MAALPAGSVVRCRPRLQPPQGCKEKTAPTYLPPQTAHISANGSPTGPRPSWELGFASAHYELTRPHIFPPRNGVIEMKKEMNEGGKTPARIILATQHNLRGTRGLMTMGRR
ncbi:beta-1,3-galactosyl-O-glycosyl-glycoprotein beta-1,6-N-acetylglucosaminyltransferase 7-like protein [Anopheles sinensis]|uniref:Beta-1,3-galactosyl-O-glycosyl-glycoprotein beta-1,6-N-acetylglucosaminyltransferase 7-like protein n=1 Tax=Anopheles sinensis TaxID=74873 RepID=A0A084VY63_ANOSI|nr:beta-1,3-galactosyl-O-glycosyl-glycoprotein beta-1,6-N-acetylglucosaminyltransferase 7-like protein [Anopheles sinensis]